MKYFRYQDDEGPLDDGVTYVETKDGYAWRQVTVNRAQSVASSIPDPTHGMALAEGDTDWAALEEVEVTEISRAEFKTPWEASLRKHDVRWMASKHAYPEGTAAHGRLRCFFPQGVIVDLEHETIGVANYEECKVSARPEHLYPGHRVSARTAGYDDVNHWILLSQPRVYGHVDDCS